MPFKPVKSNSIQAYQYNHETKTLEVVFQSGAKYTYKDVNPDVMSSVFDAAGSVGKLFHKNIAKKYKGSKSTE